MKRIITLALAAGLVFGATSGVQSANAAEVKVKGNFTTIGQWDDGSFYETDSDMNDEKQGLTVYQRFQMDLGVVASDELSGNFRIRVPNGAEWGDKTYGLNAGASAPSQSQQVRVRQAYLDWKPSSTMSLRVGMQPITLPEYMGGGNPLLDDDVAGVAFKMQVNDMIGVQVQWLRPYSDTSESEGADVDMFNIIVPLNFGMAEVTPWGSLIMAGKNSDGFDFSDGSTTGVENKMGYALGVTSLIKMDALNAGVDFLYTGTNEENNTGLLLVDLHASYDLGMMTPTAFFWYGSGRDYTKSDKSYNPLNISGSWGGVMGYSYGFDNGISMEPTMALGNADPFGTMGLGLAVNGIKVVDGLELGAHVAYVVGTNKYASNANTFYDTKLSEDDSIIDLGFSAKYQLTQGLNAFGAVGYVINGYDDAKSSDKNDANAYSFVLGMQYAF